MKVSPAVAVGERLRARRELRGWRQEDVAHAMRTALHPWQRVTVAAVESGGRAISLTEQAALCGVFGRSWVDLLRLDEERGEVHLLLSGQFCPPSTVAIETAPGVWVRWETFLEALADGGRLEWGAVGGPGPVQPDETDRKAARSLGISAEEVHRLGHDLWAAPLSAERDRILSADDNAPARSVQARRGHVTRALMQQLREEIGRRASQTDKRSGER